MRILSDTHIDFLKWRWQAIALSVLIIVAGIGTVATRGIPLGIDFTGGTALTLRFQAPVGDDQIRSAIPGNVVVQRVSGGGSDNDVLVRLPVSTEAEQGASITDQAAAAEAALRAANIGEFEVLDREVVGPIVGQDLTRKGVYATLFALGGILVYIGFRFNFTFAVGAIVAVFHDLLVTMAFLTWFGYDISLNVIAALLTITGYSVNDTIVIFDRVRENQRMMRREPLESVVNTSVNQTLSRTIITSGTTFLTVLALFALGGEVLRSFSFTMLVGIITGTYSSVFIAAAIAVIISRRRTQPVQAQAKAPQGQGQSGSRAKRARA
ncbi:MAG: protein translocase subunit SecF [Vicinamibacterales bacterium]